MYTKLSPSKIKALPSDEAIEKALAQNYKNYSPEQECSRTTLKDRWKSKWDLDPNWKHVSFPSKYSGKELHHIRSNTQSEWNGIELRFSLGLYAVPFAYERFARTVNDLGFNIVISTLGMLDKGDKDIPELFSADIHDFYSNRDLEIDRGHDHEDKDIVTLTHSTSGTGNLNNGADPQKVLQYMRRGIIGSIDIVPLCGIAANKEFHRHMNRALRFAAKVRPNVRPSETLARQIHNYFMAAAGEPRIASTIADPTLTQMVEMDNLAGDMMSTLRQIDPDQLQLPRCIIVPKRDSVTCPKVGIAAAQHIRSNLERIDTWHSSILENPYSSIRQIISAIRTFQALKNNRDLVHNQAALASPWSAPHAT